MSSAEPAPIDAENANPPAEVNNQPNPPNPVEPLPPITLFLRYLYTGTVTSSVPSKTAVGLDNIEATLGCVIELATARALLPISTIRKVYQMKSYFRVDEVLIALAFCARQNHSPELKILAYTEAITLIDNQADFILFVKYCVKISEKLNGERHLGFGHGMRRMITEWYKKFSAVELANLFGEHRGLHRWTHKTVLEHAHFRSRERPLASLAQVNAANTENGAASSESDTAAASQGATVSASSSSVQAEAASATTPAATPSTSNPIVASNPPATVSVEERDREHVLQFAFSKGSREYLQYLSDIQTPLGPGAKRLKLLQKLKTNEKLTDAIKLIRDHRFTIEQTPSHLLEKEEIWKVLLPTLTYRQIFKYFHTIRDFGFFNQNEFVNQFVTLCCDFDKLKAEHLCPVYLFTMMRLYEKNIRYLSTKKAEFYEKKVTKRKLVVNDRIKQQMEVIFTQKLIDSPPVKANYFVTIDLRQGNAKRHVLSNKFINCFEASMVLAYSIFSRESNSLIYTFTEDRDKIIALHDKMPKKNFQNAMESCKALTAAKTMQDLAAPIKEATRLKKKIDVFVVIVDSVARFCRQGQVPSKEFIDYKAKFNDRAKFVVVNLARPNPDLKISSGSDMKGFFEICGFNENVPKILTALGKHCFT